MSDSQVQKLNLDQLLAQMWTDYCQLNPSAKKIHDLFVAEGETVINDHIALRTFNHPRLGIETLAQTFKKLGYTEKNTYEFKEKKLFAKHYEHPDLRQPKIFISELELEKVSPFIRQCVNEMADQIPDSVIQSQNFSYIGRPWKMSYKTYCDLATESEYASWVAAFGFRPNHFTVLINPLKKFNDIHTLNAFIKSNGFQLNSSGGEVKGSPKEYLEQSSTMAREVEVDFLDGRYKIPACYYEFAKRYLLPHGLYYQGFVAASADKIFESTNRIK